MTKQIIGILTLSLLLLAAAAPAPAHFGMVIPSDSMVAPEGERSVTLTLSFSHPFEGIGMALAKPKTFGMVADGKTTDLASSLTQAQVMDHAAWTATVPLKRPGAHTFFMEPTPYWEPAEDLYIIHYTKTVVAAYGVDAGWDAEVGLMTEIVPLSRPFGLYAGNVFQGIVKLDGKPVPHAEVEVEYYNQDGKAQAPDDLMITQTIKADADGVFTYAAPRAGWWGFSALNGADFTFDHEGEEKEVELGAVIWVRFHDWRTK